MTTLPPLPRALICAFCRGFGNSSPNRNAWPCPKCATKGVVTR